MRLAVAVAAMSLAVAACGPGDLCKDVKCLSGQVCDPDIGQCKANPSLGGGGATGGGASSGGGTATGGGAMGGGTATGGGGATGGGSGGGAGGGSATGGGTGGGSAPANDTCASPQLIIFDGGLVDGGYVTSFTADLGAAADDYHGTCSSSTGGDLVYQLTVSTPQDITLTVKGSGGSDPVVYVGTSPCQAAGGSYTPFRDACADNTSVGEAETLTLRNVPPGDYFVFVDSYSPSMAGAPLVTVRTAPAHAGAPGDLCTAPLALFADGGSHDTVNGTTFGAFDDSTSACSATQGTDGGDVYFSFTTTSPRRLVASATPPLTWDAGLRPELYVAAAADCATGVLLASSPRLGCTFAPAPEQADELVIDPLPAGQWLLVVDSHRDDAQSPTWGAFTLNATLTAPGGAPSNEACPSATQVSLTAGPYSGTSTTDVIRGTLVGAANDQQFFCGAQQQSGPDVAYRLTTPATAGGDGGVFVKATAISDDFMTLLPSVFLQRACGTDAGMTCFEGAGTASLTSNAAAAYLVAPVNTPVYAWVDTPSTSGGPFSLRLSTATRPANDRCSGAITLPLDTSLAGTTLGAVDDYDSNGVINVQGMNDCFDDLFGADVVYAFTAPATGSYTVKLQPEPMFNAAIGIVSDCLSTNACIATSDIGLESWEEVVTFAATQGVTYFIIADGYTDDLTQPGARGGFIISVSQ